MITIIRYSGRRENIVIPSEISGKPVTSIGKIGRFVRGVG